jgi:hypothetical protein
MICQSICLNRPGIAHQLILNSPTYPSNNNILLFSMRLVENSPGFSLSNRRFQVMKQPEYEEFKKRLFLCSEIRAEIPDFCITIEYCIQVYFNFLTSQKFIVHQLEFKRIEWNNSQIFSFLSELIIKGDLNTIEHILSRSFFIDKCSVDQFADLFFKVIRSKKYSLAPIFIEKIKKFDFFILKRILLDFVTCDECYQNPEIFINVFVHAHHQGLTNTEFNMECIKSALRLKADSVVVFFLKNTKSQIMILNRLITDNQIELLNELMRFSTHMKQIKKHDYIDLSYQLLTDKKRIAYLLVGGRDRLFRLLMSHYFILIWKSDSISERKIRSLLYKLDLSINEKWNLERSRKFIVDLRDEFLSIKNGLTTQSPRSYLWVSVAELIIPILLKQSDLSKEDRSYLEDSLKVINVLNGNDTACTDDSSIKSVLDNERTAKFETLCHCYYIVIDESDISREHMIRELLYKMNLTEDEKWRLVTIKRSVLESHGLRPSKVISQYISGNHSTDSDSNSIRSAKTSTADDFLLSMENNTSDPMSVLRLSQKGVFRRAQSLTDFVPPNLGSRN